MLLVTQLFYVDAFIFLLLSPDHRTALEQAGIQTEETPDWWALTAPPGSPWWSLQQFLSGSPPGAGGQSACVVLRWQCLAQVQGNTRSAAGGHFRKADAWGQSWFRWIGGRRVLPCGLYIEGDLCSALSSKLSGKTKHYHAIAMHAGTTMPFLLLTSLPPPPPPPEPSFLSPRPPPLSLSCTLTYCWFITTELWHCR